MDPIEQILMQGRGASSGPGQTPQAAAFFQGQETSLSRRRLDLQEKQVDAELSLLPIKMKEYQQQQEMRSLTIQKQIMERDAMISSGGSLLNLAARVQSGIKEENPDFMGLEADYLGFVAQNPWIANEPPVKAIGEGLKTAQNFYQEKQRLTSDALNRKAINDNRDETTATKDTKAIISAKAKVANARTPEEKAQATDDLAELRAQTAASGTEIISDGKGGSTIRIGKIGASGGLSQATEEKRREKQIGTMNLYNHVTDLKGKVTEGTVGLRGWLSDVAQIAGQTGAAMTGMKWLGNYKNLARIDFVTAATETASEVYNEWKSDGSITKIEQEKLESMLPKTGIVETEARAQQKLDTLRELIAGRERTSASIQGRPLALVFMTPKELREKYFDYEKTHPNATPQELEKVKIELYNAAKQSPYPE